MLGTVGSGLTPGSRPDGRAPEIPEISGKNPEKPEISGNFRKLHMTYQIKALGMLVHVDTLKFQNSGKIRENLWKNCKNSGKAYFCRPNGDHPRVKANDISH